MPKGPDNGGATLAPPQAVQQAIAACQRGDWGSAEALCRSALDAQPDFFDALHLLGIIAAKTRRLPEAVELLSRAVTRNPRAAPARVNLGNVLIELKRPAEAVVCFDRALRLQPNYAQAHNNRGSALRDLKRYAEALESHERALAQNPGSPEAHNNRGNVLRDLKRPAEAVEAYERALALKADYAEAWNNRGVALGEIKRHAEALESYERAISLRPDYAAAYSNRGQALRDLNRPEEALQSYGRALELKADYIEAHCNRANALVDLKRHAEALESFDRALALAPDYPPARWIGGLTHLLLGELARGWEGNEWRWEVEQLALTQRDFAEPLWLGDAPLEGKTILLHAEQGLGDTLQFCRYAKDVAGLGARVLLEVQPPLTQILSGLDGVAQVLQKGSALPAFDYHCPLLSLPLAFKTDLNTIPLRIPYLQSDPARVAAWRDRLGPKQRPRVGLVWSGNPEHRNDHNRSIALAEIMPLISDRAEWISVQKEVRESDAPLLASSNNIRRVGDALTDFAETAALVDLMDVVLTVDSSVAHLAGAMGKPVWILLPYNPDWRWLLDREDSVWYPTARLFRQPAIGDWASVIRTVREQLERQFGAYDSNDLW